MAKKAPEINGGSLADIAFLMLIFFLVVSTMDKDTGIARILPPVADDETPIEHKERNTLMINVNQLDQVMVARKITDLSEIKDIVKNFILNPANDPNLPERKDKEVPIFGTYPVSEGVISLQNDRGTSYDIYIKVQNELTKAFNEAQNELSVKTFGKNMNEVNDEQREALRKAIPQKISEAEPRDLTGGS